MKTWPVPGSWILNWGTRSSFFSSAQRVMANWHNASEISDEAFKQSFGIMTEKLEQRSEENVHPFAITQPVAFSEEMLINLAGIYTIAEANESAAEAFENGLKCCPSYYEAKRGFGYTLMKLYVSKVLCNSEGDVEEDVPTELPPANKQRPHDREMSKYDSWTVEKCEDTAGKLLKGYPCRGPRCQERYPNVYYYLAKLMLVDKKMVEFRKYFELGQDAEGKRLPSLSLLIYH
ncbi:hypothetical protein OS493_021340 [Desmophyllum pertusum]|uniref:Uncharacterized protein n=1 Tax=Desmophyllum pertusum TaxID=174260 RepID=A0A9W9ZD10_9CNID|nr:hypothetical protein OS493_021340 [Desmophyllum pertusum]